MARTGVQENKDANTQNAAQKTQAFQTGQSAVGQYQKNISTLDSGQNVAANPYLNPSYLAAVNRGQAGALNANNDAARFQLEATNRRTGGLNTGATAGAVRDLSLQKMRLGDQLSSQRTAQDWQNNIGYQLQMAQAPLQTAQAETPYYGTATSGQGAALGNLTQFGIAQYGPWMAGIQAAGGAAAAGIPKICWIAAAVFDGWDDPRTTLVRKWMLADFEPTLIGGFVVGLYRKFGQRIAAAIPKNTILRALFTRLFSMALHKAEQRYQGGM